MKNVIVAAGGSGGHIYPALAIADALREQDSDIKITFVGTRHGLENEIVPKAGYQIWHLPIGRLHKSVSLIERLTTLALLPFALLKAMYFCLRLRPQFLLGVGGHASGPMLLAGALLFFRTVIWEPNALPGLANRLLSRFVSEAIVIFDQAKSHMKISKVKRMSYPVRKNIDSLGFLGTQGEREPLHLLIYMGSQGAQSMNSLIPELFSKYPEEMKAFKVVHQTGKKNLVRTLNRYRDLKVDGVAEVVGYIDDMETKYNWADLVVCRSGMGTLAEISSVGKPAILIPFPFASDDHQRKNAEVYVDQGAAVVIDHNDLSVECLKDELMNLKLDANKRQEMARKSFSLHDAGAVDRIAQYLLDPSGSQPVQEKI